MRLPLSREGMHQKRRARVQLHKLCPAVRKQMGKMQQEMRKLPQQMGKMQQQMGKSMQIHHLWPSACPLLSSALIQLLCKMRRVSHKVESRQNHSQHQLGQLRVVAGHMALVVEVAAEAGAAAAAGADLRNLLRLN